MNEQTRIRVYRLPNQLTNGYCFGGGNPIEFLNVDWMDAPVEMPREEIIGFIKGKRYYSPDADFLVLGDHPDFTFRIPAINKSEGVKMTDHNRIWLEPEPPSDPDYGRMWAHDNVWGNGTEYVLADLVQAPPPANKVRVTRTAFSMEEIVTFIEEATRNWPPFPALEHSDLEDVAAALESLVVKHLPPALTPQPPSMGPLAQILRRLLSGAGFEVNGDILHDFLVRATKEASNG